jgi:hypothetical protein
MATRRSKLAQFTGRTTERAASAAEHAVVGLARWATTDHTGISKMLIAMPGLGFVDTLKYSAMLLLISLAVVDVNYPDRWLEA